jgi:nitrite reductase (NADH) small subunit/3-phenylpropionate/trans-cinnamate dioxygenase ferredoxin subunit
LDRADFQTVARVGEIADGQGRSFEVAGRVVAVFNDGGTYFATDDACPHKGIPLCDGIVYDRTVVCTWHGWCFSLVDGRHLDGGRARLETYPLRVVGDEIQVAVGHESGDPPAEGDRDAR